MSAGAELNAKIAVEVFGWKPWQSKHGYWNIEIPGRDRITTYGECRPYNFDPDTGQKLEEPQWWQTSAAREIPDYSWDIGAAWQIIDKLQSVVSFEIDNCSRVAWGVRIRIHPQPDAAIFNPPIVAEVAETPALAICLAALAAITRNPALKIPTLEFTPERP